MATVFDYIFKLSADRDTMGITTGCFDMVPQTAALNLYTRDDMISFLKTYAMYEPDTWRNTMAYTLECCPLDIRMRWHNEVGDIITHNPLMAHNDADMYINVEFIKQGGQPVKVRVNEEAGMHQNVKHIGFEERRFV